MFLVFLKENHLPMFENDRRDSSKLVLFAVALLPTSYEVTIVAFTYDQRKSFIFP